MHAVTRQFLRFVLTTVVSVLCHVPLAAEPLPGATQDLDLQARLLKALLQRGAEHAPRTRHLNTDGMPRYTNRLILEQSTYLLQHAHNPVDWFPWGEAAFDKARREGKPVFLSIGYSTCHWCHVMEVESFDDAEVARLLNQHFVSIKVDREQRPDVDKTYMTAVMLLTRSGGWPMSSFLTSDGRTFWGGTYYPRDEFILMLEQIMHAWGNQRPEVEERAKQIAAAVRDLLQSRRNAAVIGEAEVGRAIAALERTRDREHGGIGTAPKFPQESNYLLLIDHALRTGDPVLERWIRFDLDAIANGGIHDHVGGGFHRYATDQQWRVPHFEKMLYNQAQLLSVYTRAYVLTAEPRYARIAKRIVEFVARDMTAPHGGFYSAWDADSVDGEGYYYTWQPGEMRQALSPDLADLAIARYHVSERGNFEQRNILYLTRGAPGSAGEDLHRIESVRRELLAARVKRAAPHRDEKIITAWNAMMVTALVETAIALDDPRAAKLGRDAMSWLWQHHGRDDGTFWRASLYGRTSIRGALDDYAALAVACIALYDLAADKQWLDRADALIRQMNLGFLDPAVGGYFMNEADALQMARPKSAADDAVPSGNELALVALAGLARRRANLDVERDAAALVSAFAGNVQQQPRAYSGMLRAIEAMRRGRPGPRAYAAHGAVRVDSRLEAGRLHVAIAVGDGFHINAHEPLDADLIATALAVDDREAGFALHDVRYPAPHLKRLGFRDDILALYQGEFEIVADIAPVTAHGQSPLLRTRLRLQACNERVCLPPETIALATPTRHHARGDGR